MFSAEEYYDVIVIGGGPAGLLAARRAAEGGSSVLLLEKETKLGVKVCGEAVSLSTLEDAGISASSRSVIKKVEGAHVYAPDGEGKVTLTSKDFSGAGRRGGAILDKPLFLTELATLAAGSGVHLLIGSKVEDVERIEDGVSVTYRVMGRPRSSRAKLVIGCDGISSIIAKKFFDRKGYELVSGLQYLMANCSVPEEDMLYFYLGFEVAPLGYVWVFPKGDGYANVGIGVRKAQAKRYLDKFIAGHPEFFGSSTIIGMGAATLPVSGLIPEIVSDNMMLAGDAAGQVIPMTGGGIHTSVIGGAVAGEVAAESIREGDYSEEFLGEYPRRYGEPWGSRIRRSLKVMRAIEKLKDNELNQLAEVLTGQDIIDLANGLNVRKVAGKLMKHPLFALRLAAALT